MTDGPLWRVCYGAPPTQPAIAPTWRLAIMRDIALTTIIFGLLPFVLVRPSLGILLWTWIGLMNPHKLTFGFAYNFPFAEVTGLVTLVAIFLSPEPKRLPSSAPAILLLALNVWMFFTTIFALFPDDAWPQLEKVAKIQLFIFLTMIVMQTRERIRALVWVSSLSIAYFGVKGGIYTLLKGGEGMVLGPAGGFVAGNTEISLALTMTVPLMRWMQMQTKRRILKWGLGIAMALVFIAILGSYSRGAFLALFAMGAAFWLKGNKKTVVAIILAVLVPAFLTFMPEAWWYRMETIRTYQQDTSATARLNSWEFGWNLANARPIAGGCRFSPSTASSACRSSSPSGSFRGGSAARSFVRRAISPSTAGQETWPE